MMTTPTKNDTDDYFTKKTKSVDGDPGAKLQDILALCIYYGGQCTVPQETKVQPCSGQIHQY